MLKLFNTLTRKVEEFKPVNPSHVGIYTCGPTVYREVHIGNFRTYILADILRRVLIVNGYQITHIKNITDVGHMRVMGSGHHQERIDPIIEEALREGKTPLQIADKYTKLFLNDEKKLNILPATQYPRATAHVKEMIDLIRILIDKGYAYETSGTVYFDVKKFKNYGRLSGNTLDKMEKLLKAVRVSVETDKKDSVDFALWKAAEPGRAMSWDSPWGQGFPGWHIECSAMSMKYLGNNFDIHTAGEDLVFPHNEDEIAQSEGVTGKKFVNYWVHSGYLLVEGEKMSRSKGNVYTVSDIEKENFDPLAFRYLTFMTHYRARMNFAWEALEGVQTALDKLRGHVGERGKPTIGCAEFEEKFKNAINDDLNMPEALSVVWELVKSDCSDPAKLKSLLKFDEVLGLNLAQSSRLKAQGLKIPEEVMGLVQGREELRREGKWEESDKAREQIEGMGYKVEDTEEGSRVRKLQSRKN